MNGLFFIIAILFFILILMTTRIFHKKQKRNIKSDRKITVRTEEDWIFILGISKDQFFKEITTYLQRDYDFPKLALIEYFNECFEEKDNWSSQISQLDINYRFRYNPTDEDQKEKFEEVFRIISEKYKNFTIIKCEYTYEDKDGKMHGFFLDNFFINKDYEIEFQIESEVRFNYKCVKKVNLIKYSLEDKVGTF